MNVCTTVMFALCLALSGRAHAEGPAPQPAGAEPSGAQPTSASDSAGSANPIDPKEAEYKRKLAELQASLKLQRGEVSIGDGLATLNITPEFAFLGPKDAQKVLQAWGNPPGDAPLGMILPSAMGPFDTDSWGVIVTYDEDGHVDDAESKKLDFSELLKQMQEGVKEHNEERKKAGYPPVQLLGWAEPPRYDAVSKKLYWAKELDFGEGSHALNYAIRVLGRKGVLQLNAVASVSQGQPPVYDAEWGPIWREVEANLA